MSRALNSLTTREWLKVIEQSNSIAEKYNQELLTTEQKNILKKIAMNGAQHPLHNIDHCDDICYNTIERMHSTHTLTVGDALKLIDRLSKQSLHIEEARLDSIIAPMM